MQSLFDAWAGGEVWSTDWRRRHAPRSAGPHHPTAQARPDRRPLRTPAGQDRTAAPDGAGILAGPDAVETITAIEIREALLRYQAVLKADWVDDTLKPLRVAWDGAQMTGVKVTGLLDLSFIKFDRAIRFTNCRFELPILLNGAELGYFNCNGSTFPWLSADKTKIHSDLDLYNIVALAINLRGAEIGGALGLGNALLALDLPTQWNTTILPMTRDGAQRPPRAALDNPDQESAEESQRRAQASLRPWLTLNSVEELARDIETTANTMSGQDLGLAPGVRQEIYKRRRGDGRISEVIAARVTVEAWAVHAGQALARLGDLIQPGLRTWLEGPGSPRWTPEFPLQADAAEIGASVFLTDNFRAFGAVSFVRTKLLGRLGCWNGFFLNPDDVALDADSSTTANSVFLSGAFSAFGRVNFADASIDGNLDCQNGLFTAPGFDALNADRCVIKGSVFLRRDPLLPGADFRSDGDVTFKHAKIGGDLCVGPGAEVECLTLDGARLDALDIKPDSLPPAGGLWLDGCVYRRLGESSQTAQYGLALLNCQPKVFRSAQLRPQPYLQMASVLTSTGLQGEGNYILMTLASLKLWRRDLPLSPSYIKRVALNVYYYSRAEFSYYWSFLAGAFQALNRRQDFSPYYLKKNRARYRRRILGVGAYLNEGTNLLLWPIRFVLWATAGHGYRPFRAVIWLVVVWLFGAVVFDTAREQRLIAPTASLSQSSSPTGPSPPFNAAVYSLDVLLPVLDLGQERSWHPIQPTETRAPSYPQYAAGPLSVLDRAAAFTRGLGSNWMTAAVRGLRAWFAGLIRANFTPAWLWIEILLGWALATFAVGGYTGLIRPPDSPR